MTISDLHSGLTATTQNPPTYAAGLGELIRAQRLYMGLVARGMAHQLRMDRRDYQRVENGQDECPPGLLDKIAACVEEFDLRVDAILAAAERGGVPLRLQVSTDPRQELDRCVVGRAAVEGLQLDPPVIIMPVADGG